MPRRTRPDPLALAIGLRVRDLREQKSLTREQLAWEAGVAKGFVSDLERGLALPTVRSLKRIADYLDLKLFDLLVFPADSDRERVVDRLRGLSQEQLRKLEAEVQRAAVGRPRRGKSV